MQLSGFISQELLKSKRGGLHRCTKRPLRSFRRANRPPFSRYHAHIRGNEGNHSSQMSKQAISITATFNLSRTIQSGRFFKLESKKIVLTFGRGEPYARIRTNARELFLMRLTNHKQHLYRWQVSRRCNNFDMRDREFCLQSLKRNVL